MWLRQDWSDVSGTFEFTRMLDTWSWSLTAVSDDGTTIECKNRTGDTWRVVDNRTPCAEVLATAVPDLTPTSGVYGSSFAVGQTFGAWEFLPDGAAHTIVGSCDGAARYSEIHVTGGLYHPIVDATVPTDFRALLQSFAVILLAAEQSGSIYVASLQGDVYPPLSAVEGRNGTLWTFDSVTETGSTVDNVAGDWCRPRPMLLPRNIISGWQKLRNGTFANSIYEAGSPDFSAGADPIYFGWAKVVEMNQQVTPSESRFHSWTETSRLDRLCLTIQ